jgi:hypothetical protein
VQAQELARALLPGGPVYWFKFVYSKPPNCEQFFSGKEVKQATLRDASNIKGCKQHEIIKRAKFNRESAKMCVGMA